jgi:hypothetical protein
MKQIRLTKPFGTKTKLLALLGFVLILLAFLFQLTKEVNRWFSTHEFKFNKVVQVQFNKPVEIVEREIRVEQIIERIGYKLPEDLTPIESYICEKFGPLDCKLALAIASAESGMRPEAYHYNTNKTLDIGLFMVNQVHWNKPGCSPQELFDPYKNVDCAHSIWETSGWSPWSVYKSGSFKDNL